MDILTEVKMALRVTTDSYNDELTALVEAAKIDLYQANVGSVDYDDPIIRRGIILYCRLYFGSPSDFDRIKRAYDELKMQLGMATGYMVEA